MAEEQEVIKAPTVPLAPNALTTLSDMMEFIGMDPDDASIPRLVKNNLIRLINSASEYIETMTSRKFALSLYTESHYGSGAQELCLGQYPIKEIITVEDSENEYSLPVNSYSAGDTGNIGVIYRDEGWPVRGYVGGLANDIKAGRKYLKVKYKAGFVLPKDVTEEAPSDLPYDLQYIVWQMVQQQWNLANNGANGLSAFTISDVSWTFDKELSTQVKDIINKYQRWA
ncbi:hypothetical protein [Lacrimispora sp.]|jgi:hypothetical protein|uniref:hypothetical protein n=1 Tax=Lacrimispora sp. TaxID=2719234 RepID=UPI0028ACF1BA|nr:hypothetical protein [Lacrimispora sp.]